MNNYDAMLISALKKDKLNQINNIPKDSEIDYIFSKQFEESMKLFFNSLDSKAQVRRNNSEILKRAAVFIICTFSLALAVIMINPTTRAGFINAVVEFYEEHIKFSFAQGLAEAGEFENIEDVKVTYIPKGFILTATEGIYEAKDYIYENNSGDFFKVNVSYNENLSVQTDKLQSSFEKIKTGNKDAYLIYSESETKYGTVIIMDSKITITIYGYLEKDELLKVAEGIK